MCSGATRPDHADVVDARQTLLITERSELSSEHGRARDAELLGDGCSGDHIVTGDHPDADAGVLGVVDRLHRGIAGWVDHGDERCHLEIGDVAEQIAVGVEGGRVEIADGCCHDPISLTLHAGDGTVCLLLQGLVPRHAGTTDAGRRGALQHGRCGSFHEAAHHALSR